MTTTARRRWLDFVGKLVIGGMVGIALAFAAGVLMQRKLLQSSDYLPVVMAAVFALSGLTVWFNPNYRKIRRPGASLWPQCAMALVSAAALAAPVLMPPAIDPVIGFFLVVLLYVGAWQVTQSVVRRSDELFQRVVVDTNQVAAKVIFSALFLYGAAERLDIVPHGASIWVLNGIVVWFYFMVAQFAWMRRGLDNPLVSED
jgi:hypothetical protein